MNGNLLEAIQSLVKVKKVDADVVFDALEMVLLTAYKKETGSNAKTSIKLNRETGDYQIFEEKTVVESIDPESENAIMRSRRRCQEDRQKLPKQAIF